MVPQRPVELGRPNPGEVSAHGDAIRQLPAAHGMERQRQRRHGGIHVLKYTNGWLAKDNQPLQEARETLPAHPSRNV